MKFEYNLKHHQEYIPQYIPLRDRVKMAKEHIENHGGGDQTLWPYQRFRMTVAELLEAAELESE